MEDCKGLAQEVLIVQTCLSKGGSEKPRINYCQIKWDTGGKSITIIILHKFVISSKMKGIQIFKMRHLLLSLHFQASLTPLS